MRKFIRKYYQELIAVALIAGFWGSIWGIHAYHSYQANAFEKAHTIPFNPDIANK
jgi:hypothetical protein